MLGRHNPLPILSKFRSQVWTEVLSEKGGLIITFFGLKQGQDFSGEPGGTPPLFLNYFLLLTFLSKRIS